MDDQNSQNANRDIFNIENVQGDVKVINYDKQPRSRQEFNARKRLLNEMRTELAGRKPLHQAAMLNLGKEQQPHQVQRPWDVSVKIGEQRSFQLPSETSILEVFEEPSIGGKLLILGKAGSGKTTTLLELAQRLYDRAEMDSNAPIPVILELSSWQTITKEERSKSTIQEWIFSSLQSKGVSKKIGEKWIRYELVLLLDGLDELPSEHQGKCVQAINQLLEGEFSPQYLAVCSRKEEYENCKEILRLNGAVYLEDLSVEQIEDYFTSIHLEDLWDSIKSSEKIVNFLRQPLFLAITSIAYQQIDIEEWKNCNTEERATDYLLGIYRILVTTTDVNQSTSKSHSNQNTMSTHYRLIWLSKYLEKSKQDWIIVNKIQPIMPIELYEKINNILSYLRLLFCFYVTSKILHLEVLLKIIMFSDISSSISSIFIILALGIISYMIMPIELYEKINNTLSYLRLLFCFYVTSKILHLEVLSKIIMFSDISSSIFSIFIILALGITSYLIVRISYLILFEWIDSDKIYFNELNLGNLWRVTSNFTKIILDVIVSVVFPLFANMIGSISVWH